MKKKKLFLGLGILIVLAGVTAVRKNKQPVTEVNEENLIPVRVAQVERSVFREIVSVSGDVLPWAEVTVYPEASGRVESLPVREGQYVSRGELIAQIDQEKSTLTVSQIESQLASSKISLDKLRKDYERSKRLFEQKVIAEKSMDDAKTALDIAARNVESLESQLSLANVRLKDARVAAPIKGVITKKYIDQGQIANGPIVTIADIEKVKVTVPVGEKEITRIRKGQRAEIHVDAYHGKIFAGVVHNVFPGVDMQTRTAQVEIAVDNSARNLKPGMFARADIIISSRENAFVIPIDSIIEKEGGSYVFVAENDKARIRQITTGMEKDERIEVLSGLEEGTSLIIEGQRSLQEGSKIFVAR